MRFAVIFSAHWLLIPLWCCAAHCGLIYSLLLPEPPSFVQSLEDTSCMVGSEISMKCVLSGSYPMTFIWIKDGCELREDEHVRMSYEAQSTELHLKNAQLSDTGTYVCEVQNTGGTQRCAAVLTVSGLSHLTSGENTIITFVGGTASLELRPVSETDAGDYLCKATNASGSDFCKSKVTVKGNLTPLYHAG
uniref:Ig-like domain-containing protein n=1 Tax=Oryzias latipes TaxID=8090 RepID=A0A3P9GXR0_ORYLA